MSAREFLDYLSGSPLLRLRWYVMRELGVSPCSREARRLSDRAVVYLAAHMVLDRRQSGFGEGAASEVNGSFDGGRFEALRGKRREESDGI